MLTLNHHNCQHRLHQLCSILYIDKEEEIKHKQQSQPDSMDKSLDLMKKLNDFLGK